MNDLTEKRQLFMSHLSHLIGLQFSHLRLPIDALKNIEPSQIGTIVGTLVDAMIPMMDELGKVGLTKHPGIIKDRESYPDFLHAETKFRAELKLLYVDNPDLDIKRPKTKREPSARVTQKVTIRTIHSEIDFLLIVVYQLRQLLLDPLVVSPTIIDLEIIPMDEIIEARDKRLIDTGGKWFGDYETPAILSRLGKIKRKNLSPVDSLAYGRKAKENRDYNEDTNFGKLNRIPQKDLVKVLKKHGYKSAEDAE